ncbi:hypothetical protein C5167_023879 [Papaver somniferum]|uniref:Uncharacterized protein n=1 Tax=Papaver somniferum TaxID=3469 RepID=A0A4Y7JM07_PAPSO|nr:hypothetical protein C5167_023879 [Papaver somniferum]
MAKLHNKNTAAPSRINYWPSTKDYFDRLMFNWDLIFS